MTQHRRYLAHPARKVQVRERPDGAVPTITGYAAVFHRAGDPTTEFEMLPGAVERILPTAFDRALSERQDVRALFNHDPSQILGRTAAGTLRLATDGVGLRYEIDPPDTPAARALAESIRRGDVTGSSFAFLPTKTARAAGENGVTYFDREDVDLFDVGPVTFPAYPGSESQVRAACRAEVDAAAAEAAARAAVEVANVLAWIDAELAGD